LDHEELLEQNRLLRERVAALEGAATSGLDPALVALVANAPGFMNVITVDGRIVATGRTSEGFGSVIGRSMFEFIDERYHGAVREALKRVCDSQIATEYELVGYGENGEPGHTWFTRVIPIVDGGVVKAMVMVPTDITERVRLQRSLEESEHAMRVTLDATRMGLWRWDMVSDEIRWDARVRQIFGVTETPQTVQEYMRLIHADDHPLLERVIREAITLGSFPTFEHRVHVPEGTPDRFVLASGAVIKDAQGKPTAIIGGVLDITEQKRMTLQFERAERVQALGQLTAGIAHNFNNLLAAILPNLEIAKRESPEPVQRRLSIALDASLQARELVKSLLTFAGKRSPQATDPSLVKDVVGRIDSICRVTFPREIALVQHVADDVRAVAIPPSDLEQVLLNLLFNARDAVLDTTDRARRIEIRVDRMPEAVEPRRVRFRVIDNGVGMSAAVRGQIFEPFFTTKPPHRGSGLGLANALARVREAHGTLECESELGVGTTFTFLVAEAPLKATGPAHSLPPQAKTGAGELILVVDDEPLVRNVAAHVLKNEGYETVEAGSAQEARAVLDAQGDKVRLVLLDMSMPMESGVEALPTLRARCAAPIVFFTGWATDVPQGAAAVITKPARSHELCRVVRAVLDEHRTQS
jgi:two-component system, cell cycle sensor histidine kinase and response regulator CckA